MIKKVLTFILLSGFFVQLSAFDILHPEDFLGLTISALFEAEETPLEIFPHRGVESDEDNVVFYYSGGFYLFLYKNRVWQVRYDMSSEMLPLNLSIGAERSTVLADFLKRELVPLVSEADSVTFQLQKTPWPMRMKLYFTEDKLMDLYVYRADF